MQSLYLLLLKHTPLLHLIDHVLLIFRVDLPLRGPNAPWKFWKTLWRLVGRLSFTGRLPIASTSSTYTTSTRTLSTAQNVSSSSWKGKIYRQKAYTSFLISNYVLVPWLNDVKKDTHFENRFGCKGFECNADIWIHLYGRLLWSPLILPVIVCYIVHNSNTLQ